MVAQSSLSRRKALSAMATLPAVAVAGCTSPDPVTVDVEITASDVEHEVDIIDLTETIDGGDFHAWEFVLDDTFDVNYTVEVTEGPDVNVYIVTNEEFQNLEQQEDFRAIDDAMWSGVGMVDDTVQLDAGNYWLAVINADVEPVN